MGKPKSKDERMRSGKEFSFSKKAVKNREKRAQKRSAKRGKK